MARGKTPPTRRELLAREKKSQRREQNLNNKITALQFCEIPLIPKFPFSKLVREVMMQFKDNFRISAVALAAIQEATELYLTFLFSDAYLLTYHRRRVTLDRADIRMVLHIRKTGCR